MKVQSFPSKKGKAQVFTVDWSVKVGKLSTTVSTAVWTVDSGSATISNEALSSNVASATITTGSEGCALIKVVATYADGQHIDPHFFKIKTEDPYCVQSTTGRY